jgi:CBS domain-containing protein
MKIKSILSEKGSEVLTIGSDATVNEAVTMLAKHRIGALIISDGGGTIKGILSERDIIRHLAEDGTGILKHKIADVMTVNVKVCSEEHTVNDAMEIMTRGRFRHLPVEKAGKLIGVISIGDVVKRKIEETEREAEEIRTYIATG